MNDTPRDELLHYCRASVDACSPTVVVPPRLTEVMGAGLRDNAVERRKVAIFGVGKCAAPMARGVEGAVNGKMVTSMVYIPSGYDCSVSKGTAVLVGDHPIPTARNVANTRRFVDAIRATPQDTTVVFVLSGGAGALLFEPPEGLRLDAVQSMYRTLYLSGADIATMNVVRKLTSHHKAGDVAQTVYPRPLVSIIMSDVIGDRLDVIGCGPTYPDGSTIEDAIQIMQQYAASDPFVGDIEKWLTSTSGRRFAESRRYPNAIFAGTRNIVLPCESVLLEFQRLLTQAGRVTRRTRSVRGTTLDEARWFSNEIRAPGRYVLAVAEPLSCFARSDRRGGRLAEFALASAIKIDGAVATWLLAMATDGLDGTTDAAGALVSGITCEKLRRAGIDPTCWLQEGKSFEALRTAEAIVPRFTSEVNHCDVLVGVS